MTEYYKPQKSPYQFQRRVPNVQSLNHPVQDEVKKNLGTYTLTATFLEDTHTLQILKDFPNIAAFLCTLKCGDRVLSEGRGMAVISKSNKWFEKSLAMAKNQSLLDAVAKSTRLLDILPTNVGPRENTKVFFPNIYKEKETSDGITEKQKNYLLQLLRSNEASEEEIEEVYTLSKEEAAEKIGFLAPSR